jgi:hypothetical protein
MAIGSFEMSSLSLAFREVSSECSSNAKSLPTAKALKNRQACVGFEIESYTSSIFGIDVETYQFRNGFVGVGLEEIGLWQREMFFIFDHLQDESVFLSDSELQR